MHKFSSIHHSFRLQKLIFSISLLLCGVNLLWPPVGSAQLEQIMVPNTASTSQSNQLTNVLVSSSGIASPTAIDEAKLPVRVVIPKLSIDLPVKATPVINGYWQVSSSTATYGLGSGIIGETGNSVIFAHSRNDQFLPIKKISMGSNIYVYTKSKWFNYKVNSIKKVDPTNIDVIKPTSEHILTLYTCDGPNDSKRFVVQATIAGTKGE